MAMTAGIEGTGPHAKLKNLRNRAKQLNYELNLIEQGHKRQYASSTYKRMLKDVRTEIRNINAEIKAKKD
jgi:hypothetical protein